MASEPGWGGGAFLIDSVEPGWTLILIADDGRAPGLATGWEHVSARAVHGEAADLLAHVRPSRTRGRIPSWREMAQVKDLCWDADDVVVQYHPARSRYVNRHAHVLHLWRPIHVAIPTPPLELV